MPNVGQRWLQLLRILDVLGRWRRPVDVFAKVFALLTFDTLFPSYPLLGEGEWLGPESNRGHEDFQSSALPTELPSLTLHFAESLREGSDIPARCGCQAREHVGSVRIWKAGEKTAGVARRGAPVSSGIHSCLAPLQIQIWTLPKLKWFLILKLDVMQRGP